MRKLLLFLSSLLLAPSSAVAFDTAKHPFGLGLQLGDPTAITAKYYVDRNWAIQGGIGSITFTGLGVYADALYTLPDAVKTNTKSFSLPVFVGLGVKAGGRYAYRYRYYSQSYGYGYVFEPRLGVRVPVGAAIHLADTPLELQLEIAPELGNFGLGLDAGLALRYYF